MSGTFPPIIIVAAQAAERKWKVPASVSLAQWAIESFWGARNMGAANNCFGLKPWRFDQKAVLVNTHEEVNGKLVPVKAKFCAFVSIADCFDAHGEFLVRNNRYKPAFLAADGIAFARAVAKAGYATDSGYAGKLVDLITRYGLMQFDGPRIVLPAVPATALTPIATTPGALVLNGIIGKINQAAVSDAVARGVAPPVSSPGPVALPAATPTLWSHIVALFTRKAV